MVWWRLSSLLCLEDLLPVPLIKEASDGRLDLGRSQVLRGHWPGPRFVNYFLTSNILMTLK